LALTCGARSTVNVDQSMVNTGLVQTRLVGLDSGRADPDTWQAVALPRRSRGPPLGLVHKQGLRWAQALVYGGLRLLPVNRVHPSPLSVWSACTGCMCVWLARGSLCFHLRRVPASDVLTGVVLRRRWHPIKVGESFPRQWRARWWCLGGSRGSLGHWPQRSVAWARRCTGMAW
jgi:hypothetical protein